MEDATGVMASPLDGLDHSQYPMSPWWDLMETTIATLDRDEVIAALEASTRDRRDSIGGEFSYDLEYLLKQRLKALKD